MQALIVVTSATRLDDTHPTGVWLDEYATIYLALCEAGVDLTVASPAGGPAPIDPKTTPDAGAEVRWRRALEALSQTHRLAEVDAEAFDAIVFPGGHGPLMDLATDPRAAGLAGAFAADGRIVGALCHGPAALLEARDADGAPLVSGRKVTGFTNGEEALAGLQTAVPFLLETRLREAGAAFEHALLPGGCHVVRDANLVTGQNPASSDTFARVLLEALAERQRETLAG
jgi:putative intracellular protease/amidase